MLVYHKKNSYFVPDTDAKLVPMGSYVLTDDGKAEFRALCCNSLIYYPLGVKAQGIYLFFYII